MRCNIFLFICLIPIVNSCKKENRCDCFKSSGNYIGTYRDVTNFNCINISDKIDLYLTQGNHFEVRVEAGSNLQSLIKTEIAGETLKVYNKNRCNWVRGYNEIIKVFVTAPYFKHVLNNGLGNIETTNTITQDLITFRAANAGDIRLNVNTGTLKASAHGNGDIYLTGVTGSLENDYNGSSSLYASDLQVNNYVYLHSVTIGHAYINAPLNGYMDIGIDQIGNIYYKGNPKFINLKQNSTGKLIKQ